MREGEELKAPRHASAAATRDDHVTTRDIVPTLATLLLWLPSIYKYRLISVTDINPPYLLLLLQYKSYCPKFAKEIVVNQVVNFKLPYG
jgi:hypothetical protein